MKVLPFTIPVPHDKTVIVQTDDIPFFYPHLHRHQEIQLTWIREGEGTLVAENNMHTFRTGEIYWIGANQPHVFKSDPSYFEPDSLKRVRTLNIFFQLSANQSTGNQLTPNQLIGSEGHGQLSSLFDLPETRSIKNFVMNWQTGFKVPPEHEKDIANRMMSVRDSGGIDRLIEFMGLLKQLSALTPAAPLSSGGQQLPYSEHEGIRLGSIYNYIMQQYDKPITLEDVAGQAHMTPQAFCRYFKKHTRHTFVSFLNEVRIHEACKKLTDGSYTSIATVAYNCGFNSITNFNRVFKGVTGRSPSDYVASWYQAALSSAST